MPRKLTETYGAIHQWVRRVWGTPAICAHCTVGKGKRFEWAVKKGSKPSRNREDWLRLCSVCHGIYDKGGKPSWNKGMRKKRPELRCGWCRNWFIQRRVKQAFCSQACASKNNGQVPKSC